MIIRSLVSSFALFLTVNVSAVDKKAEKKEVEKKEVVEKAKASCNIFIKAMTWGGCRKKVKRALSKIEGIESYKIDAKTKIVSIVIADKSKFDSAKAVKTIKAESGFLATVK